MIDFRDLLCKKLTSPNAMAASAKCEEDLLELQSYEEKKIKTRVVHPRIFKTVVHIFAYLFS